LPPTLAPFAKIARPTSLAFANGGWIVAQSLDDHSHRGRSTQVVISAENHTGQVAFAVTFAFYVNSAPTTVPVTPGAPAWARRQL